ncbi:serine hydrolase domain-containing protein [Kitasatospora sp. NPDC085879]|uniref:serine hydrolase domain-containing protein n=1 Tax=Kitasatospora sp. NPDC085879 TaxID=3154769 RepID=UPI003446A7AD
MSITYMGAALLRLVDEGRAGLDDPVSRWLPDLPHGHRITLRMLADSSSGLVDYVTAPGFSDDERLTIAVSTTEDPDSPGGRTAHLITQRSAAFLAPDHPIPDFG